MNSSKRNKKGKLTKMVAFCKDTWTAKDENKKEKEEINTRESKITSMRGEIK